MDRLTPELARILRKRIRKLVEKARYYPAKCYHMDKVTEDVIRPYLPLPTRDRDSRTVETNKGEG
jgi:hypothetical protein